MFNLNNIRKVLIFQSEDLTDPYNLKSRSVYIIYFKNFLSIKKKICFENHIKCTSFNDHGDISYTKKITDAEKLFIDYLSKNNIDIIVGTYTGKEITQDEHDTILRNGHWKTGDLKENKKLKYSKENIFKLIFHKDIQ